MDKYVQDKTNIIYGGKGPGFRKDLGGSLGYRVWCLIF